MSAPGPLTFRLLRLLADGEFHSGEELARRLRVSRSTVWKALHAVQDWGVTLFKVNGRGYRLVTPVDWLDAQLVCGHLGQAAECMRIEIVDAVDSTNTLLLRRALTGEPGGLAVAAELQTHGRGRRGRPWHAGLGSGLTFSLLWRFEQGVGALGGLSLAVSVAVLRALRELGADEIGLKWPNDLLWRHQKLAGILIELEGDAMGPSVAVIGIGVNVVLPSEVRNRIDQAVCDLAGMGLRVERNRLLGRILAHLVQVLEVFATGGFAPMRLEWERAHALAGRELMVALPDGGGETGLAAGVGDDGALLLETRSGLRRLYSGEVSVRPLQPDLRSA
ncbi:MAG: biotin--[acetyl-CoA-carboxylase] ligase [Burkholderiales bacterium]|nr:biotin--[acetyl-CoA-carboxylase] ligase [Burkholderiales bacterium]